MPVRCTSLFVSRRVDHRSGDGWWRRWPGSALRCRCREGGRSYPAALRLGLHDPIERQHDEDDEGLKGGHGQADQQVSFADIDQQDDQPQIDGDYGPDRPVPIDRPPIKAKIEIRSSTFHQFRIIGQPKRLLV